MERLGPDDQGGFNWTVTFTSDNQDGDLPLITMETDALKGLETLIEVGCTTVNLTQRIGITCSCVIVSTTRVGMACSSRRNVYESRHLVPEQLTM